jgi:hypothetical protein
MYHYPGDTEKMGEEGGRGERAHSAQGPAHGQLMDYLGRRVVGWQSSAIRIRDVKWLILECYAKDSFVSLGLKLNF